jgi:hypothetical protein
VQKMLQIDGNDSAVCNAVYNGFLHGDCTTNIAHFAKLLSILLNIRDNK